MKWPETFWRRLFLSVGFTVPAVFLISLAVGAMREDAVADTMLYAFLPLAVAMIVTSVILAGVARPGTSFWAPLWGGKG